MCIFGAKFQVAFEDIKCVLWNPFVWCSRVTSRKQLGTCRESKLHHGNIKIV